MFRITFFSDAYIINIIGYQFTSVDTSVTLLSGHITAATVSATTCKQMDFFQNNSTPIAKVSQNCVGLKDWQSGWLFKIWDVIITLKTGGFEDVGRTEKFLDIEKKKQPNAEEGCVFQKPDSVYIFQRCV